mmetsp:Transcript_27730/g.49243  ORF Transcript_27730/g.49243 Transcript_27730/m.49243 type:complete len:327 (+) Transcript_27730:163-1143(+)
MKMTSTGSVPVPLARSANSPTIVNGTNHAIVVFLERGTLYNKQVLQPGEAVSMTRQETGGAGVLPYRVHAVIGDERALPTKADSVKNLVKVSAVPAAFVAGVLVTAYSAGTLTGASAALAPLVRGMVVNGIVIDSTALVAGSVMASRAQAVTEMLMKNEKDKFMVVSPRFRPGQRYLMVTGGLSDGSMKIEEIPRRKLKKVRITAMKAPMITETEEDNRIYKEENPQQQHDAIVHVECKENQEENAEIQLDAMVINDESKEKQERERTLQPIDNSSNCKQVQKQQSEKDPNGNGRKITHKLSWMNRNRKPRQEQAGTQNSIPATVY